MTQNESLYIFTYCVAQKYNFFKKLEYWETYRNMSQRIQVFICSLAWKKNLTYVSHEIHSGKFSYKSLR